MMVNCFLILDVLDLGVKIKSFGIVLESCKISVLDMALETIIWKQES